MSFNPVHAKLEQYLANLTTNSHQYGAKLSEYRHNSPENKAKLLGQLSADIQDQVTKLTGARPDASQTEFITDQIKRFLESYAKIQDKSNISDIKKISVRMSNFDPRLDSSMSLSDIINQAHERIFGKSVFDRIDAINASTDDTINETAHQVLNGLSETEDNIRDDLKVWDRHKRVRDAVKEDGTPDQEKLDEIEREVIQEEIDEAAAPYEKKVKGLLIGKFVSTLNNALHKLTGNMEARFNNSHLVNASDMMGFTATPMSGVVAVKVFGPFMAKALDVFEYSEPGLGSTDASKKFIDILKKGDFSREDSRFLDKVTRHLQHEISNSSLKTREKLLDGYKSSNGELDFKHADTVLFNNRENLKLLDKLLRPSMDNSIPPSSTINSRLIAQFLSPLMRGHYEIDNALTERLNERYGDLPGVSRLSIAKELEALKTEKPFEKGAELDYLRRLRPTGEMEKFAYNSPDNNMMLLRVNNNLGHLGFAAGIIAKVATSIGPEHTAERLLSAKSIKDCVGILRDGWKAGDYNFATALKSLIPTKSSIAEFVNGFQRDNGIFINEKAEYLQNTFGKIGSFEKDEILGLNKDDAGKLLDLALAAAELTPIGAKIAVIRKGLTALKAASSLKDGDVSKALGDVFDDKTMKTLKGLSNMNNLASGTAQQDSSLENKVDVAVSEMKAFESPAPAPGPKRS